MGRYGEITSLTLPHESGSVHVPEGPTVKVDDVAEPIVDSHAPNVSIPSYWPSLHLCHTWCARCDQQCTWWTLSYIVRHTRCFYRRGRL